MAVNIEGYFKQTENTNKNNNNKVQNEQSFKMSHF